MGWMTRSLGSAIAQATRLFGDSVDYCLCTAGLHRFAGEESSWPRRLQPVDWRALSEEDNAELSRLVLCERRDANPFTFGYWWKWFRSVSDQPPPESVLDGDIVITAHPTRVELWSAASTAATSQDDRWPVEQPLWRIRIYKWIDACPRLYSGLVSLPPHLRYVRDMLAVLKDQSLAPGHNGCQNTSEQPRYGAGHLSRGSEPLRSARSRNSLLDARLRTLSTYGLQVFHRMFGATILVRV